MPELSFQVEGAEPGRSATPTLLFRLRVSDRSGAPIHTVVLRCQVRIRPAQRRYDAGEQERLLDLFGTPERWGQTVREMPWAHVSTVVPPFVGEAVIDLPVPCSHDFDLAATRYFDALADGEIPLAFLFSGTVFYQSDEGRLQVAQIPWEKEAAFRLPALTWRTLMNRHHPDSGWLRLRKDVLDRLLRYKSRHGLTTCEQALEALLASQETPS